MQSIGIASFAAGLLLALAAHGDDEALQKENAAIEGAWKVVSAETALGKDPNANGAILEFDKDGKSFKVTLSGETKKGTFTLNPAGKPKEIDFKVAGDDSTIEGIYLLDKTTLKICVTLLSTDGRPSEFAAKEGKNFLVVEFERAK